MLDALDKSTRLGRVYAALVTHPRATSAQIATAVGVSDRLAKDALRRLAAEGLVRCRDDVTPALWEAEPPDQVVDDILGTEETRLRMARTASRELSRLHWMARHETAHYPALEVIRDPLQIREYARMLANLAVHEFRSFNAPPFLTSGDADEVAAQLDAQLRSRRKGVQYKAIWWSGVFDDPEVSVIARTMMDSGEQTRVLAEVPMKMFVADDQRAMLPLDPDDVTDGATLVVHPSGLLNALISVFDTLWRIAGPMPASATPDDPLTRDERQILELMVTGATDEMIARHLGVSRRTIIRYSTQMFERIGAKTRFQAGVQAVRQGWL